MLSAAKSQSAVPPAPEDKAEMKPIAIQSPVDIRSAALTVLAVIAIVLILQYAQSVIIPIVLGVLISYALEPLVAWLTRWRLPRSLAAAIVLAVVVAAVGSLIYGLRSQGSAILAELPQAARRLREKVERGPSRAANPIQQVQKAANELEKAATAAAPPPPNTNVQRVVVDPPSINVGEYVMWLTVGTALLGAIWILTLTRG